MRSYLIIPRSLAGVLTTNAFLPRVVRTRSTGSARDISRLTFLLFSCVALLWLSCGILLQTLPVLTANGVTLVLSAFTLFLMIRDPPSRQRRLQAADRRTL
jgi:MtN3 and saliva related transmembrane protein